VLKEGDKAPKFSLDSDSGDKISLDDFAGKTLVLYFYPKDDTPGCTREAQAFTSSRRAIEKAGGAVIGVSRDTVASHCRFRDKYTLKWPLVSDPELVLHKAYGAWGEKTMYGKKILGAIRSTFLVKNGKVVRLWRNVKVDGHADQVLAALSGTSEAAPKKKATPKAKAAPKKKSAPKARAKSAAKTSTKKSARARKR
jgi:thioredoxin-dependent peroxiredoxin